ncbi:MAG: PhnE/PtxC family ABC transporter permease, partial [Anaerolineales bacterium]
QVSLERPREPRRQEQFVRILRALARPDIFEYEQEIVQVEAPVLVHDPCLLDNIDIPEPDTSGPYMLVTPYCANPNTEIQVEGFGFSPNSQGPINFIPKGDLDISIQLGNFQSDSTGYFSEIVKLPRRQPVQEEQSIRSITRTNVGLPKLTRTAHETWAKIVETVFLALLATTLGTILAVPISFLAAKNIMKEVKSPVTSVSLAIIAWPIGIWLGMSAGRWASEISQLITNDTALNVTGLIFSPILLWGSVRLALPQLDTPASSNFMRLVRPIIFLFGAMVGIIVLFLLAHLAIQGGNRIAPSLGNFGFLGTFVSNLGDILHALIIGVVALLVGGALSSIASGFGQTITERLPTTLLKGINLVVTSVAGFTLAALLGGLVQWLYLINNPIQTLWIPGGVGALIGLSIATLAKSKDSIPIGLWIYYIFRTILNTLRSIEAFILAIIFVVLLSIGPFAGVMALALHTVAALAKLYSEQVESILPGPLEAIRATGATRLQTIVYAVIPQIIPPYISFTMYRWDINVRMSTIIGFVGGGGIGFLLQQNINLLNYRAASVQMLAITIVVALMDYISSTLREKAV